MPALADILLKGHNRVRLTAQCVELVDSHIANRGGLRGIALKGGYAMLKKAKPDILPRAMHHLLPDFVAALEPLYQQFMADAGGHGRGFAAFLKTHSRTATDALLGVADVRAQATHNVAARSFYHRMRAGAGEEMMIVVPQLGVILEGHLPR